MSRHLELRHAWRVCETLRRLAQHAANEPRASPAEVADQRLLAAALVVARDCVATELGTTSSWTPQQENFPAWDPAMGNEGG